MGIPKLSLVSYICFLVTACGGGGGGEGSGSGRSQTYSYDLVAGDYTNKTWDSVAMATIVDFDVDGLSLIHI